MNDVPVEVSAPAEGTGGQVPPGGDAARVGNPTPVAPASSARGSTAGSELAAGVVGANGTADGRWRRLHPLSPVVRSGRGVLALLAAVGASMSVPTAGPGGIRWTDIVVLAIVVVAATVNWLVTRWKLDGSTLRIETGLIRRDSRQLPVARIQAVDLVRPFAARVLGLTELRVRLAGSSHADGRLAYLPEAAAGELRAWLLAAHHGLDPATPEPAERVLETVPAGRLLASVAASAAGLACAAVIGGVTAAALSPAGLAAVAGTVVWSAVVCVPLVWRQVSAQYGFTVAASPDGIRIRRGLLATVAETIPLTRVQAVRKIEPVLWWPMRWCRLEVDIAGSPGRDKAAGSARERKLLLPVGRLAQADRLVRLVTAATAPQQPVRHPGPGVGPAQGVRSGEVGRTLSRPPRRARWKAPLSYHFLAAGIDRALAVAVTGRIRRVTTWVPLHKAQSVRFVQGPVQRRLALASVHLDAAGHGVRAEFRDRALGEATALVSELAALSRTARRQAQLPGPHGRGTGATPPASGHPVAGSHGPGHGGG